jgi:protein CpxP
LEKENVMTSIDNIPLLPEPPIHQPAQKDVKRGRLSGWKRTFVIVGTLTGGIAIGAGGLALAAAPGHFGWPHGPRLERIQRFVAGALDSVGATAAQEAKVHDIIAASFADIAPDPKERDAVHKQVLDLLRAPTVDRAAAEKLRVDEVARFDAKSKKIVSAVLDAADQLTPEQRGKLADHLEELAKRGPWGGAHDGRMDGERHHPMDDSHGPDQGPDDSPN